MPKFSPDLIARGILDGFEDGQEDIFPDRCGLQWQTAGAMVQARP